MAFATLVAAARGDGLVYMPGRLLPRRSAMRRRRLPGGSLSCWCAQARSLWVRDSLGPWLHRVALVARREANRRREAEQRAAEISVGWTGDAAQDELADIIHQEIDRLPERHRIPIVLCMLEERSHEEAARHLWCPVGTVKSRLAQFAMQLRAATLPSGSRSGGRSTGPHQELDGLSG